MPITDIIFLALAVIAAILGIVGTILPALPGPPLCFASMVVAYFVCPGQMSVSLLIWMLVLTVAVSIMDYTIPIMFTKMGGGSKPAMWGTTIGMFAGMFFMPWGLILGPLIGAFVGELSHNKNYTHATKVAMMSFLSFMLSTGIKLLASLAMTFFTLQAIWYHVEG